MQGISKKFFTSILLGWFLCLVMPLVAQEPSFGNWLVYIGSMQINDRWNWEQSIQHRNYNVIGDLHQFLFRSGLGYNLSEKNNNVAIGYDYVANLRYDETGKKSLRVPEHRLYQQFISHQEAGRFHWRHRYRIEQLFFPEQFKLRFRYALFVQVPISNRALQDHTLYLSSYNEIFIATTGNAFDQNWLYGGLGYRVHAGLSLELGYMNQFLGSRHRDQLNVIAIVHF